MILYESSKASVLTEMSPRWLRGRPGERAALLLCALWHAALFLWLFKVTGLYYETGSDTQHVYWPAARKLLAGHLPYLDPHFFVEYPPLGTAIFLLPALAHPSSLRAFDWLFAAEMLLADIALLLCLIALARRLRLSVVGTVLAYSLLMPLLGAVVCQRYDLVPAALVLGALWALLAGRSAWAWTLLLLATLAKLYPVVLAPLFLLYEWRRGRRAGALLYSVGLAGFVIAWQALAPASLRYFLLWETRRGLEIESLFGSMALLLHALGLPAHIVPPSVYGSYDVATVLTPVLEALSTLLTVATLAALYLAYARHAISHDYAADAEAAPDTTTVSLRPGGEKFLIGAAPGPVARPSGASRRPLTRQDGISNSVQARVARVLIAFAALAVLALLLWDKLLSIQFLLWVLPLLVLQPRGRWRVVALCLVILPLSQWLFPFHWNDLWAFRTLPVLAMAARNGLLLALFVLLWRHVDTAPL